MKYVWRTYSLVILLAASIAGAQSVPIPQGGGISAPTSAEYLVTATNIDLTAERLIAGRPLRTGSNAVAIMDPTTTFFIKEEFFARSNTFATGVGELRWVGANGSLTMQPAEAGHPGIFRREQAVASGQIASMHTRTTGGTGVMSPADSFDSIWVFRLGTNDANVTLRLGLMNDASAASPPADGIYLERLATDTMWHVVSRASSTSTRQNSQITTNTTDWITLRMRRTDASTITFTFAATEVTTNTNVPTAMLQPAIQMLTANAGARVADFDYFDLLITGLSR